MAGLSVSLYGLALFLPSYTFVTPDKRIDVHQIGFQSLVLPAVPTAYLVNAFFVLLALRLIRASGAEKERAALNAALSICFALTCFGYVFGDPEPGTTVRFGPGAWLWFWSVMACLGASMFSLRRQRRDSR